MFNIIIRWLLIISAGLFCLTPPVFGGDVELAEDSTLNGIFKRGELRIGLEIEYIPFVMLNKHSGLRQKAVRSSDTRRKGQQLNLIGFDIDIGIEMANELGVKPVFVNTSWSSIIPALLLGRHDVIFCGMSITEDRKKKVDFADSFLTIGQTILLNKKHEGVVKSYKDLNDSKYIVVSTPATTCEAAVFKFMPNCTYSPSDLSKDGAMRVLNGEADAFVYDMPSNAVFANMHSKKIVFLDKPFTKEQLAWAIRQNDPEFKKFLNEFLAKIKTDGRFDRIYDKWFNKTDWFKHIR